MMCLSALDNCFYQLKRTDLILYFAGNMFWMYQNISHFSRGLIEHSEHGKHPTRVGWTPGVDFYSARIL